MHAGSFVGFHITFGSYIFTQNFKSSNPISGLKHGRGYYLPSFVHCALFYFGKYKMQQTKYDYNALKLEYFKSDIDEIKGFRLDKGLTYSSRTREMTKGRGQEKQERRKSIVEKALERQKDKISKELEIPVEDLLKIKKDVIDLMKHKVKQYTQKVELAVDGEDVPINTKDLEKIRKVAKVELGEPMIVTKNEGKTTLETSGPLVEIICSEDADETEDDETEDDE